MPIIDQQLRTPDFWAPRRFLLAPIPEIFEAAALLQRAVEAHLATDYELAENLIRQADNPAIAEWTESRWAKLVPHIHRWRKVDNLPPLLSREARQSARMPNKEVMQKLIERDGYRCRYCGIPVIRQEVRSAIRSAYPEALRWGKRNCEQHAAFQCMWLAYEHVVPHSRGGDCSMENMIISCWPCNGGKAQYTLEELGLEDPRLFAPERTDWDGLERFK